MMTQIVDQSKTECFAWDLFQWYKRGYILLSDCVLWRYKIPIFSLVQDSKQF